MSLYSTPQRCTGQERERQGSGWLEGIRTMRDDSTSCPRRRRFACRIGRGCTRDVAIVPMKQITPLACVAAICAATKPDEFAVSIGCPPGFDGNDGPVCAKLRVMIRHHCGDALILVPSFTGGSILMFGP